MAPTVPSGTPVDTAARFAEPAPQPEVVRVNRGMMTGLNLLPALREFGAALLDYDRWAYLARADIRLRYRRTVLGPWWATLSTGVMIGSVGLVFGGIFGGEMATYIPFFATGTIVWTLISGSLTEGCGVFTSASGLIKSIPAPLLVHVLRMLTRQLIVLAHHLVLIVLLWILIRWPVGWSVLLALPGFFILVSALVGAALTLGVLSTRFRDFQQIIGTALQLLFLLTPIVWMPQSLRAGHTGLVLYFNPLYHLIEVVRGPILGHPPEPRVWLSAIGWTALSLAIGVATYGRFRHRIAYWL
jgi:ABC-type polysaccharide/polyol phosphate export permease